MKNKPSKTYNIVVEETYISEVINKVFSKCFKYLKKNQTGEWGEKTQTTTF